MALTIELPDDVARQLNEKSRQLNVRPEDLAAAAVRELLARQDDRFQKFLTETLEENRELYRRLA